MYFKIKKINFNNINFYLHTLNNNKQNYNSTTSLKIKNLDHYIWWMNNQNLKKYVLMKKNKKMIFFWYKKKVDRIFFFSGWWPVNKKIDIETIFFITKKLISLSKNLIHVAIISKKNKFSIKLHKHFDFEYLNKKNRVFGEIIKILNKKNDNRFVIMIKKNQRQKNI